MKPKIPNPKSLIRETQNCDTQPSLIISSEEPKSEPSTKWERSRTMSWARRVGAWIWILQEIVGMNRAETDEVIGVRVLRLLRGLHRRPDVHCCHLWRHFQMWRRVFYFLRFLLWHLGDNCGFGWKFFIGFLLDLWVIDISGGMSNILLTRMDCVDLGFSAWLHLGFVAAVWGFFFFLFFFVNWDARFAMVGGYSWGIWSPVLVCFGGWVNRRCVWWFWLKWVWSFVWWLRKWRKIWAWCLLCLAWTRCSEENLGIGIWVFWIFCECYVICLDCLRIFRCSTMYWDFIFWLDLTNISLSILMLVCTTQQQD